VKFSTISPYIIFCNQRVAVVVIGSCENVICSLIVVLLSRCRSCRGRLRSLRVLRIRAAPLRTRCLFGVEAGSLDILPVSELTCMWEAAAQ